MIRLFNPEAQALAELAPLLAEGARLSRGRAYHRKGHVTDVAVGAGLVTASVRGSEPDPYDVTIACREATENERSAIEADVVAAVPGPLDVAFTCGCADWGDPCKHGVAALLAFAQEVDDAPELLLAWRGVDDVTPPPPPGTESLNEPGPVPISTTERAAPAPPRPAPAAPQPPSPARVPAIRSRWGTREATPAAAALDEDDHDESTEVTPLDEFFTGAMPDRADALIGPLEEIQLDAYAKVHIIVENVDLAPVIAAAIDAVADHWLSR